MWVFLEHRAQFQRAEEARYTDEHRRGRRWDGFVGEAELDVRRDEAGIDDFRRAIAEKFGSRNVHVEIFDRYRTTADGDEYKLISGDGLQRRPL